MTKCRCRKLTSLRKPGRRIRDSRNYTPQKILRATILFSMYRNVKAPKLNRYLMAIPKDAEYPFHLHYFRYCPKVTDFNTFEKGNATPKPIEQFWHFSKIMKLWHFCLLVLFFLKFHRFTKIQLEFDFSLKVSLKCIAANVVCVKFIFANDGHV